MKGLKFSHQSSSRDEEPTIDKKFPLVLVRWWDAFSVQGWRSASDISHEAADNRTVGWLIHKDRHYVILAQTVGGQDGNDPNVHTRFHIPAAMVRSINYLGMPRRLTKQANSR